MPKKSIWLRIEEGAEKYLPLATSVILPSIYAVWLWRSGDPLPDDTKELFAAVISVAGVALAFIATIQGYLLSILNSDIVKRMRQVGGLEAVFTHFKSSFKACSICLASTGLMLFFKFSGAQTLLHKAAFVAWLGAALYAFIACLRTINTFQDLLQKASTER